MKKKRTSEIHVRFSFVFASILIYEKETTILQKCNIMVSIS